MTSQILQGDALSLLRTLPAESVHACITSPPYWGLRAYNTAPQVWGGDDGCAHEWGTEPTRRNRWGLDKDASAKQMSSRGNAWEVSQGDTCHKCGAWRGELGLEPMPELFIAHLVMVFREVRRVLHPSATCWVNLGDSYWGGKGRSGYELPHEAEARRGLGQTMQHSHNVPGYMDMRPSDGKHPTIKPKDLCMIPARFALAMQADGWWLRSAAPWVKRCLSGGTMVYVRSQKGDMPMMVKDLVRLNPATVNLWNGTRWTQVKGWQQTKYNPEWTQERRKASAHWRQGDGAEMVGSLEIELRSGERIGCTPEHRWPTQRGIIAADDLHIGDVIESTNLPAPADGVNPGGLPDEAIGWLIGLYLAEGNHDDKAIHIASHTKEVEARLSKLVPIAESYHGTCQVYQKVGHAATITLYGKILRAILNEYVSGDSAKTKHLSVKCWQRSNTFLRAVLDGYLEGDGHHDKDNKRWRLGFTQNDALASDLRCLCARLGIGLRLKRANGEYQGKKYPMWRGEIRFHRPSSPTPGGFKAHPDTEIVAIRHSRARQFWDIEVEDEPHLFALASGVLTHNSAMPESVTDRPTSAVEYIFMFAKSQTYFFDMEAVRKPNTQATIERDGYLRRNAGVKDGHVGSKVYRGDDTPMVSNPNGRSRRNADWWFESVGMLIYGDEIVGYDVNPQPLKEAHFAVFPEKLVEPCILAGTSAHGVCAACGAPWARVVEREKHPARDVEAQRTAAAARTGRRDGHTPGPSGMLDMTHTTGWRAGCSCGADVVPATVLDPFCGSGTTGVVAKKLGRAFVGLELNPAYVAMAARRIAQVQPPLLVGA